MVHYIWILQMLEYLEAISLSKYYYFLKSNKVIYRLLAKQISQIVCGFKSLSLQNPD